MTVQGAEKRHSAGMRVSAGLSAEFCIHRGAGAKAPPGPRSLKPLALGMKCAQAISQHCDTLSSGSMAAHSARPISVQMPPIQLRVWISLIDGCEYLTVVSISTCCISSNHLRYWRHRPKRQNWLTHWPGNHPRTPLKAPALVSHRGRRFKALANRALASNGSVMLKRVMSEPARACLAKAPLSVCCTCDPLGRGSNA